jgi:hypothetical protein
VKAAVPIVKEAKRRGLSFIVAGGHAVIFHGYARNTFDFDLVVRKLDRAEWVECAKACGFSLFRDGPSVLQFEPPTDEIYATDMMLVEEETFLKLSNGAVDSPEFGGVRIVSLHHLLALKCHAVKHTTGSRIVKDADDVIMLVQANGLDPVSAEMRELFLKHGTAEFYDKVKRAVAKK